MTLLARICEWVGRLTNTIVMVPHPVVVGNCAEEILYGLIKARRECKKLVLLHQYTLPKPLNYRLTNGDLIDVDSPYKALSRSDFWFIFGSAFVTLYAGFCRALRPFARRAGYPLGSDSFYPGVGYWTLWQPAEVMSEFSWDVVRSYNWLRELHTPIPVYLSIQKKAVAEDERARMALPMDAWFVCLHVREGGWHGDSMSERNASIENYVEAILEITSRGGWVVRMGDSSMTKLPAMERLIDYPFTSSKNYAMDLYLLSECRLFIGMQSGIIEVARLFQRPMLLSNMASWIFPPPQLKGDIGVLKHIYSKSRQRFLSIREWLLEPFESNSFRELGEDYVLYENEPEEIREAVAEYFEQDGSSEPTPVQREFNDLWRDRWRAIVGCPIRPQDGNMDMFNRYRIAARLVGSAGLISNSYLQKNWLFDEGIRQSPKLRRRPHV